MSLKITTVDAREWMRPMGSTPLYPPLSLLPDRDPQDMGDALALDEAVLDEAPMSYRYRWNAFLGTPDGAA